MKRTDLTVLHFEEMSALARALMSLPAEFCCHSYFPESFGSWTAVVRCKGVRLRIVFDGRDSRYLVQSSPSRESPDRWQDTDWHFAAGSQHDVPVAGLVAAVERQANRPEQTDRPPARC